MVQRPVARSSQLVQWLVVTVEPDGTVLGVIEAVGAEAGGDIVAGGRVEPGGTVLGNAEAGEMEKAGILAGRDLFLQWYVLHQDLIWFAVRTSRPASSIVLMT